MFFLTNIDLPRLQTEPDQSLFATGISTWVMRSEKSFRKNGRIEHIILQCLGIRKPEVLSC